MCRPFSGFYPREAMIARLLAVVVCLSVCVCLSHAGIVSKRLNVGSRKQHHVIAVVRSHEPFIFLRH